MTMRCLSAIYRYTSLADVEIIIIDDGSTDETKKIKIAGSKVIRNKTNLGFAVAVNQGIIASKGNYICIFNNDMIDSPNWIDHLLEGLKIKNMGMVSSTLIEPSEMKFDLFKRLTSANRNEPATISLWEKDGPWLFKREVFEKVGLFNEIFKYCQYEDSDFLLRMAYAGYKHGKAENSFVYHYSSLTQKGELKRRIGSDYIKKNRESYLKLWKTIDVDFERAFKGIPQKGMTKEDLKKALNNYRISNHPDRVKI